MSGKFRHRQDPSWASWPLIFRTRIEVRETDSIPAETPSFVHNYGRACHRVYLYVQTCVNLLDATKQRPGMKGASSGAKIAKFNPEFGCI